MPGENANAVAELVIGFMIALTRTVPQYDREMRAGEWTRDDCASRHELRHHRLGIVGLGQVGMRVARLAVAFGMRVRAFDPYISDEDFAQRGAARVASLDALAARSDILTLHVPFTPETRTMIGANETGVAPIRRDRLINAARGEVLDVDAALDALARNAPRRTGHRRLRSRAAHAHLARRPAPHPHAAHRRLHHRGEERHRREAVREDRRVLRVRFRIHVLP